MTRPLNEGELTGVDADGAMLREWDGVVLLKALAATEAGNCEPMPLEIPAGVRATAIELIDPAAGLFNLECYLDEAGEQYAFAHGHGRDVRLVEKIEDKKAVEL
ncbi:MAG: hypothetical protein GC203_04775 [Phenylobacterium sp.]|uniref:hypothetical protein n=1 Tax=Phenylobacterium sp. TaxID=1871053 RepID=UPI0025ECD883|nr:hypothetical protein [Phenylobacterium sp.]MBI1197157.1 hypothetical protein [Phenylobacterium sp.]